MAYTVKLYYEDSSVEIEKDVNDVSFVGEYMILCLTDMKTRKVFPLKYLSVYEIKDQPVVNPKRQAKKSTKKAK